MIFSLQSYHKVEDVGNISSVFAYEEHEFNVKVAESKDEIVELLALSMSVKKMD
jgi:hypothetical protein